MQEANNRDIYYDPYDFEIDTDPYPIWKRMRDEQPLYYNAKHDFFALSRYDDVERCSRDWRTYSSAKGTVLEIIKRGTPLQPGTFIFEDPPEHDVHRALLAGVFSPRMIAELEPKVRKFCVRSLDPLVGKGAFDFIADLGATVPMWTIGMLLGIPEQDQVAIRDRVDHALGVDDEGAARLQSGLESGNYAVFAEYIEWREKHPSDDMITALLQAEYRDTQGTLRRLTKPELLGYVYLLAAAGNETTSRLIGWAGKVLAEHPEQRRELVADPSLIGAAIEELLRYESPSPVQARYVTRDVELYGRLVPAGSVMLLLTGSANRDERRFPHGERFDIHRKDKTHVAFGHGVHFCMGAALARLEARIALEEVLKRFPTWEIDRERAVQARTSTVRGWSSLPVRIP